MPVAFRTLHRHYFATRAAWCDRVDPRPLVWARPNSHRRPAWMLGLPGRRSSEPKRGIRSGRVAKRLPEAEKTAEERSTKIDMHIECNAMSPLDCWRHCAYARASFGRPGAAVRAGGGPRVAGAEWWASIQVL